MSLKGVYESKMGCVYSLKISGVIVHITGLTLTYRRVIITVSYRIRHERLNNGSEWYSLAEKYPVSSNYRAIGLVINYAATIRKEL